MDSVCAAYSYAVLKNTIDPDNEYVPVMLGKANGNTKKLFENLQIELPQFLRDVFSRVSEVQKKGEFSITSHDPLYILMEIFQHHHPTVVPVLDDGVFKGLISADDINAFFLRENSGATRQRYLLSEENIERIIEGVYIQRGSIDTVRAPYMIGAMEYGMYLDRLECLTEKPVLIVGYRKEHIEAAIKNQLPGIVITGVSDPSKMDIDFSSFKGFVYISFLDTAETLRLLKLSTPIIDILPADNPDMKIEGDMLFDDAKRKLQESEYRGLSVYTDGKWSGYVTRRCFLDKPRQRIILVDHNEAEQSVKGIEEAEITEILDHHRLAPPRMKTPIYIVSEPLGSTCTIIYEQFKKWDVDIDPLTAKVLLAGLTSDTVMLKSPTTTLYDKQVAAMLCEIGGIEDYNAFSHAIFSDGTSLSERDPETVILSDMKTYNEKNVKFAIGQVEVMTLEEVRDIKEGYVKELERIRDKNGLDWCMLLISDVISENSVLLMTEHDKEKYLIYEKLESGIYTLPGVLSRKKQLLPEILRVLEN